MLLVGCNLPKKGKLLVEYYIMADSAAGIVGFSSHNGQNLFLNLRMMTGNGVMHDGLTVLDDYGTNLDRLWSGDRVGVQRRSNGALHFYVNGEDQGAVTGHVPERIYGVVDLRSDRSGLNNLN